uniref:Uncharacterized protein n=1 Tax=Phenylobacterium glaciei TaxID=2803784 RepID=A0A974P287_9CAUL|nr:hypothetical protein JKL49_24880 [Phenylobacterium glaciei]
MDGVQAAALGQKLGGDILGLLDGGLVTESARGQHGVDLGVDRGAFTQQQG